MPKIVRVRILQSFCDARNSAIPLNPKKIVEAPADVAERWVRTGHGEAAPNEAQLDYTWTISKPLADQKERNLIAECMYGRGTARPIPRYGSSIEGIATTLALARRISECERIGRDLSINAPDRPDILTANQGIMDALQRAQTALSRAAAPAPRITTQKAPKVRSVAPASFGELAASR